MKQKHILLFSQARQGHHAVMEWLCQQTPTGTYHNNLIVKKNEIRNRNWQYDYGPEGLSQIRRQSKPINVLETPGTADIIVYNFLNNLKNIEAIEKMFVPEKPVVSMVVRDLYNFTASAKHRGLTQIPKRVSQWKKTIKIILSRKDIVDINFNEWFESYQYRIRLSQRLGISRGTSDLPEHSKIGQSTFEKKVEAKDLKILDRWKHFEDNENYWKLFDEEAIELNKQYFGFSYEEE